MSLLIAIIGIWAAFLYATLGEIITEKSGHLNLGTPGIMCIGGAGGALGLSLYLNWCGGPSNVNGFFMVFIPFLFTVIFSGLIGLLYSFFTVTLRANQNVTGLAISTFGLGIFKFITGNFNNSEDLRLTEILKYNRTIIANPSSLGWFGELFLSYGWMTYMAIIIAVVAAIVLKKTRIGLNLRSVGENPACADAVGINVSRYRYAATVIGSIISGMGGSFMALDYLSCNFSSADQTISSIGWLAVALVIFCIWNPKLAILGTFAFAALYISIISINGNLAIKQLLSAVPYILTVVVLVLITIVGKNKVRAPESLGLNYFREDR